MVSADGSLSTEMENLSSLSTLYFSLLIFLQLNLLNRAISMLYLLNFSTAGMNGSVALMLLIPSGLFYILLYRIAFLRKFFGSPTELRVLSISSTIFGVLSLFDSALLATIGSVLFLLFSYAIIQLYLTLHGRDLIYGISIGIGLHLTLNSVFDTLSPYAFTTGKIIFLVILGIWLGLAIYIRKLKYYGLDAMKSGHANLSPIYLFLFNWVVFYAYPGVIASWQYPQQGLFGMQIFVSYHLKLLLITIFSLGSIFLVSYLLDHPRSRDRKILGVMLVLSLLSASEIVFWGILSIISVPIYIFTYLMLMAHLLDQNGGKYAHVYTGLSQLLALLVVFLFILAGNWAFVPEFLQDITKGLAGFWLMVSSALLPIYAIIPVWRYKL